MLLAQPDDGLGGGGGLLGGLCYAVEEEAEPAFPVATSIRIGGSGGRGAGTNAVYPAGCFTNRPAREPRSAKTSPYSPPVK